MAIHDARITQLQLFSASFPVGRPLVVECPSQPRHVTGDISYSLILTSKRCFPMNSGSEEVSDLPQMTHTSELAEPAKACGCEYPSDGAVLKTQPHQLFIILDSASSIEMAEGFLSITNWIL